MLSDHKALVRVHGLAACVAWPAREALLAVVALLVGSHIHVAGVGGDALVGGILIHALREAVRHTTTGKWCVCSCMFDCVARSEKP